MYLTQSLHRAMQRHPDKIALRHLSEHDEKAVDFRTLVSRVARLAAALRRRGVKNGDRIAMLGANSDMMVELLFATWWAGAVACPLNTRWSASEWRFALSDASPALFVFDTEYAETVRSLHTGQVSSVSTINLAGEADAVAPMPDSRMGGDSLAALVYTGGTTGRAKGVMLSHANFWTSAMARAAELQNAPDGVALLVTPLFHVAGLSRLVGQSIVGATLLTMPTFRADAVLKAIEQHQVSDAMFVPSMLQMLFDASGFDAGRVQSLTQIGFGAAPMPPDLLARALSVWPRANFFQAYGMTEAAATVCINPPFNHCGEALRGERWRSIGRAGLGVEIQVVDTEGKEAPRGTVGEIIVRGPMVMRGYWNLQAETENALRDGWLHTGDGGRMDDEGYIYIADRLKDMIISGGENVYPIEVEAVLRSHPSVADAAVIGVADKRWGEAVHAVVVLRDRTSLEGESEAAKQLSSELVEWCRRSLAGYKCPRSVEFVGMLPLSATGKVLKNQLRQQSK